MRVNYFFVKHRKKLFFWLGIFLGLCLLSHAAFASDTSGGGLPFDSWFTTLRESMTGPFAFTVSIIGLIGAGATLIFGGDMNGFLRTLVFMVLVLSFIIAAQNTLSAITGQGVEITPLPSITTTKR